MQNVLMEYLTDRLIGIAYQEIEQEKLLHLHRHALIKAQANEYVRQSQVRLILHPLAERLQAMLGKEEAIRKIDAHPRRPAQQNRHCQGLWRRQPAQFAADIGC